jgi:hypothetical protein
MLTNSIVPPPLTPHQSDDEVYVRLPISLFCIEGDLHSRLKI